MIRKLFRLRVLMVIALIAAIAYGVQWLRRGVNMPSKSFAGNLDPLDAYQLRLRDNLKAHVDMLAGTIGERNMNHLDELNKAADYIHGKLQEQGYEVHEDTYDLMGSMVRIPYATLKGSSNATFVVGAHYDSVIGSPGANDNASGVAAVLELARMLKNESPKKSLMFVLFPNEEPPYFQTKQMGSYVFASAFERHNLKHDGMISLETIGYYSDAPRSQQYPAAIAHLYPTTGNFIAFVGDTKARDLLEKSIAEFRLTTHFPSEGASLPRAIEGVGWSDHWSFWQVGVPAIMITDTATFRYPHYHKSTDTPDKLDYDKMARVVLGMKRVVLKLVNQEPGK